MVVYIMLVNIIVINKNSSYVQGENHNTDIRNVVTTKPWLPQAKSVLGLQMLLESREGRGVSPGWEGMGTVSQKGQIVSGIRVWRIIWGEGSGITIGKQE